MIVNQAADLPLEAKRGQTFYLGTIKWEDPVDPSADPIVYSPVDITPWTLQAQVRKTPHSNGEPLASMSSAEMTQPGDWVEIVDAAEGLFSIHISAATMATIKAGEWAWDLEAVSGSVSIPLLEGTFTVTGEVTR